MQKYWKRSACPYDCPDGCGLLIETDGTHVYRVKGDPDHPITQGFTCAKMTHYEKTIHHKDRILTPLKRVGKKGRGEFIPITWEQAVKEITDTWKKIIATEGAQAILPYSYAGTEHLIQNKSGEAFFHYMGASLLERTICSKAKSAGFDQILGSTQGRNPFILKDSDLIIIWGSNTAVTYLHAYEKILAAKKKGARVILIETYESPTAAIADEVILVRPGSDHALALGIAQQMKQQGLVNEDFLKKFSYGWEEFLASIDSYTPDNMAPICEISPDKIEQLATLLGTAAHPVIQIGSGISRHGNGAMTIRSIISLQALNGALGDAKAGILGVLSSSRFFHMDAVTRPDFLKKPVRSINMNQIGDALCDLIPPIRSLYVYNVNPANVAPDQTKVLRGLAREDLFTVVHERFLTDTAKYADIILPADTSVEHGDIAAPYGHLCAQRTDPVIAPLGEAKCNWDTFCLLAKAMGYDDPFFQMSNEEAVSYLINASSLLYKNWKPETKERFLNGYGVLLPIDDPHHYKTPSGKIELTNDTLPPEDRLPHEKENYGGKYPLRLVTAPHIHTLNSTFLEREDLVEKRGRMQLMLHPDDARKRQIKHGDMIEAYNDLASVIFSANVTTKVKAGTVIAEGIYRSSQSENGLTVNALLSQKLTDYGRAASLNDNTIEICLYKEN